MKLSRKEMRSRFGTKLLKPSLTKKAHRAECDINNIVERYRKTGVVQHVKNSVARYLDAASIPDYQAALNIVIESQETFMGLPSKVRSEFQNDPAQFVEYFSNPVDDRRNQLLVEYGLFEKRVSQEPVKSLKDDDNSKSAKAD